MHHAAQAYGKVAKQTSSPRDLEADLLLKAAARLQAVCDGWEQDRGPVEEALLYNRKLWSIFLTSVTRQDNPLPEQVRNNVANLGVFVMNQTMSLITEPKREKLGALISINRELAAGLLGRGA
jgi:flagellar protein FlaF